MAPFVHQCGLRMVKGIVGIFLLGVGGLAQTRPAATEPSSVAAQAIAPAAGGGYVGAERCRSCHGAEFREFGKTQHAAIAPAKPDAVTGCEMCHGPGKAHADAEEGAQGNDAAAVAATKLIFAFHTNPQKNAERCMQCHKTSKEQAGFEQSPHMRHGVVCSDCHSMQRRGIRSGRTSRMRKQRFSRRRNCPRRTAIGGFQQVVDQPHRWARYPSTTSRYPTPGSVCRCRGRAGSDSSFRRNCATYTLRYCACSV